MVLDGQVLPRKVGGAVLDGYAVNDEDARRYTSIAAQRALMKIVDFSSLVSQTDVFLYRSCLR